LKRYPTSLICIGAPAICLRHIPCMTTSDFLLRKSMKTLFTLFSLAFLAVIVQGGEESGKKVEPLPCKDRGSKASCNRYMKKDNFEELCKENRRIGRYLCCKTCAEKLGVEVNEDGKFKDPRSVICHVDEPYIKNQSKESAMTICIENTTYLRVSI
ncbi:hypothetical protein T08_10559, partial [Trichinella sp. T8]